MKPKSFSRSISFIQKGILILRSSSETSMVKAYEFSLKAFADKRGKLGKWMGKIMMKSCREISEKNCLIAEI